jgi:DNA recombination protein RmuC
LPFLLVAIGAALGAALVRIFLHARLRNARDTAAALQDARAYTDRCEQRATQAALASERLSTELAHARRELDQRVAALQGHAQTEAARLTAERDEARADVEALRSELIGSHRREAQASAAHAKELAAARADLERVAAVADEKLAAVADLNERYAAAFKALSSDALQANNERFLQLAKQTFTRLQSESRNDLQAQHRAVAELVTPVTDTLRKVDGQLNRLDADRREAQGALHAQLRQISEGQEKLRGETSNLVAALRQPQTRGRWGEMQLRRVVEVAGMVSHCDFLEQATVEADGRNLRPDMVVHLPGGKSVVVDAKAPLAAYLDSLEAETDEAREECLCRHAKHLRQHMRQLSAKSYWSQFDNTPDFVVLFLPGEQFSAAALQADPSLIEEAVNQSVFLATPMTLITLLRAVAYGWQQEKVAEGARAISELGRDLHTRLTKLTEHVQTLGRRLNSSVDAYNQTVGSLESRVLPSARKFAEHGVVAAGQELPALTKVASSVRAGAAEPAGEQAPPVSGEAGPTALPNAKAA